MAAVKELLRAEADGTLSFGDFTLGSKTKKDNFEFEGDIYKVKTFSEITKLEKNGMFVYESVPGSSVEEFRETADEAGTMKTNLSGKLSVSVELSADKSAQVKVVKC